MKYSDFMGGGGSKSEVIITFGAYHIYKELFMPVVPML